MLAKAIFFISQVGKAAEKCSMSKYPQVFGAEDGDTEITCVSSLANDNRKLVVGGRTNSQTVSGLT